MPRLLLIYNPNSTNFKRVKKEILDQKFQLFSSYDLSEEYTIKQTGFDQNVKNLTKELRDGDFCLALGGDATAAIAANAILESKKDVTLAVLPYGNFNDLARTLGTMKLEDLNVCSLESGDDSDDDTFETFSRRRERTERSAPRDDRCRSRADEKFTFRLEATPSGRRSVDGRAQACRESTITESSQHGPSGEKVRSRKGMLTARLFYPLAIYIDGKFWRYALCYVTIGMTARAVELFDDPKFRNYMKKGHKSSWRSYLALAKWYFKNRHKRVFLPEFTLNGKPTKKHASDYAAVNGRSMCRVMRGGTDYLRPAVFRSENLKTTSFPHLFILMAQSILFRTPGTDTKGDLLEFKHPAEVELQAEGEYQIFQNVKKIEIKKGTNPLKVITKY